MNSITFPVTQEHLEKANSQIGNYGMKYVCACLLAVAIRDHLKLPDDSTTVRVLGRNICIGKDTYQTSPEVDRLITLYDNYFIAITQLQQVKKLAILQAALPQTVSI